MRVCNLHIVSQNIGTVMFQRFQADLNIASDGLMLLAAGVTSACQGDAQQRCPQVMTRWSRQTYAACILIRYAK